MKNNYLIFLLGALILISGCTGDTTDTNTPTQDSLSFSMELSDSQVYQGDSIYLTLNLGNYYTNDLTNLYISSSKSLPDISFNVEGTNTLASQEQGVWYFEIKTESITSARTYSFNPVICFDYNQLKMAWFDASPDSDSTNAIDYSSSINGPLSISFDGFTNFNSETNFGHMDYYVKYSYANNYNGLEPNVDLDDFKISQGTYALKHLSSLSLKPLLYSSKLSYVDDSGYCYDNGDLSMCTLDETQNVYASTEFRFSIMSTDLNEDISTYFYNDINYTICLQTTNEVSFTVVKSNE